MTHAMRSASLAGALAASAVECEAIGEVIAVNVRWLHSTASTT